VLTAHLQWQSIGGVADEVWMQKHRELFAVTSSERPIEPTSGRRHITARVDCHGLPALNTTSSG
jgi:hypothetical protein